jgi:glutaredoxin
MRYLVIACILMFILSILSCNNINHKKTTKLLEPPVVDLYSADWCYWCDQSEKFLKDNKIKYAKYDIELEEGYKRLVSEAARINYTGELGAIPTFIIGNKMIIGYDPIEVMYTVKRFKFENDITDKVQNKIYYKNFNIFKIKDKK